MNSYQQNRNVDTELRKSELDKEPQATQQPKLKITQQRGQHRHTLSPFLNQDLPVMPQPPVRKVSRPRARRFNTTTTNIDQIQVSGMHGHHTSPIKILFEANGSEYGKRQSMQDSDISHLKPGTLPLPLSNLKKINSCLQQELYNKGENNRTTQEVQTSCRPSARDSQDPQFKNIGESIMEFSIDKLDAEVEAKEFNDDIQVDEVALDQMMAEQKLAVEKMMRHRHSPLYQATTSNKRKNSRGSDLTINLPQSGPTSARGALVSTQKKADSRGMQASPLQRNQMLHQIYIKVSNTSEVPSPPTQKIDSVPARHRDTKKLDSQNSTNSISPAMEQQISSSKGAKRAYSIKNKRVSSELLNPNMQSNSIDGRFATINSLVVQPMLLGVRAVKRIKKTSITNVSLSKIQTSRTAAGDKNQRSQIGIKEFVFEKNQNDRNKQAKSKGRNKMLKSSQRNAKNNKLQVANAPITESEPIMNKDLETAKDNEKLHLLIGPQIVQWLSVDQAAHAQASGLQIITSIDYTGQVDKDNTQSQNNYFQGSPIVIDQNSRLGQHFMKETRMRKQMEKDEKDVNLLQEKEKQERKEILDYFGRNLTSNKLPQQPFARFIDRKVTAQMKKEYEMHKLKEERELIWKEHHMEQKTAKNQTSFSSLPRQQAEFADECSPKHAMIAIHQQSKATFQECMPFSQQEPMDHLRPWSQTNILSTGVSVENTHMQGADSFNPFNKRPSTEVYGYAANSQNVLSLSTNQKEDTKRHSDSKQQERESALAVEIVHGGGQGPDYIRQLSPGNYHELHKVLYKSLNQTDILNLQRPTTTQPGSKKMQQNTSQIPNPNAIILHSNSLNRIAPILESRLISPTPQTFQQMHKSTSPQVKTVLTEGGQFSIENFGDHIKSKYLPCTIRKLYYNELMLRKPIFIGASKKGIGFKAPFEQPRANERTSMAKENQQLLAKHSRVFSEESRPISPGLQNDETFLTICSARMNTNKKRAMSPQQQIHYSYRPARGEQSTQFEFMQTDFMDKKTLYGGGEPASCGSISGIDPRAVVEIQHLIQNQASDQALQTMSKHTHELSTRPLGSGDLTLGEITASDVRKSKVIFSVKKNQSQMQQSKYDASAHNFKPLENQAKNAANDPQSSGTVLKTSSLTAQEYQIAQGQQQRKRVTSASNAHDRERQATILTTKENLLNPTNSQMDCCFEGNGQQIRVYKMKLVEQKDGQSASQRSQVELKSVSLNTKNSPRSNDNNMQSANFIRSFTCADLESPDLFINRQGSFNRRIRSAKNGINLLSAGAQVVQAVPSAEERESGGNRSGPLDCSPEQLLQQSPINVKSNSNFAINDRIAQQNDVSTGPQPVSSSQTETDQNLVQQQSNPKWYPVKNSAEIGSPHKTNCHKSQKRIEAKLIERKQTLSPSVVNMRLNKTACIVMPGRETKKKLPISVLNSIKQAQTKQPQRNSPQTGSLTVEQIAILANTANHDQNSFSRQQQIMMMSENSPNIPRSRSPIRKNSRGSFYISDDSQRTLTPLASKNDLSHFQGQVIHRGQKKNKKQKTTSKFCGSAQKSQLSSHSQNITGPYNIESSSPLIRESRMRESNFRSDLMIENQQTVLTQAVQQIPCTCSLKGSYKLENLLAQKQLSGSNQQNSKQNRVVFVMRNEENKTGTINRDSSIHLRQTNNDLAHLPRYLKHTLATLSNTENELRVNESLEEDATPNSFGRMVKNSKDKYNTRLMKSAMSKNLRISSGFRKERLILRSSGGHRSKKKKEARRSQPSINRLSHGQKETFSDYNDLSPTSSQRWIQMLPVVNSNGSLAIASKNNESYGDIVNQKGQKKTDLGSSKPHHAPQRSLIEENKTNLQVKPRLGKNPNQCPPRRIDQREPRRLKNLKPRVSLIVPREEKPTLQKQQTSYLSNQEKPDKKENGVVAGIISGELMDEETIASKKVIHVTVQNESEQRRSSSFTSEDKRNQIRKDQQRSVQYPGFSTLSPVQIISSDDLSHIDMQIAEPFNDRYRLAQLKCKTDHVVVSDCSHAINKLPSQPDFRQQLDQLIGNRLRPKSQRSIGTQRMTRLQKFYQTQRGRNIMSLASSKRGAGAVVYRKEGQIMSDLAISTNFNATTQQETMETLSNNMENKAILSAETSGKVTCVHQSSLKMIGKTAPIVMSRDQSQYARQVKIDGSNFADKHDMVQSVQRFSIHLSPKNQTMAFHEKNEDGQVECQYHKANFEGQNSPSGEIMRHQTFVADPYVDTLKAKHHHAQTESRQAFSLTNAKNTQFNSKVNTLQNSLEKSPNQKQLVKPVIQKRLNESKTVTQTRLAKVLSKTTDLVMEYANDKTVILTGVSSPTTTIGLPPNSKRIQARNQNGSVVRKEELPKPMTQTQHEQVKGLWRSTRVDSATDRRTMLSSRADDMASKRGLNTSQSLQKRIVKGLTTRHFTANLKAQGIQVNQTQVDILQSRNMSNSLARTQTARLRVSDMGNKMAKQVSLNKKIEYCRRTLVPRDIPGKTVSSPINHYEFDRTMTGSLINFTTEHPVKTTARLRQHGHMLSPDLNQLLSPTNFR